MDLPWYVFILQFVSGLFLANGVPHFVQGISGRPFHTGFASPPGIGESPAILNVAWGWANLVVGSALLWFFWPKGGEVVFEWALVWLGALAAGLYLARLFGRVHARRAMRDRA